MILELCSLNKTFIFRVIIVRSSRRPYPIGQFSFFFSLTYYNCIGYNPRGGKFCVHEDCWSLSLISLIVHQTLLWALTGKKHRPTVKKSTKQTTLCAILTSKNFQLKYAFQQNHHFFSLSLNSNVILSAILQLWSKKSDWVKYPLYPTNINMIGLRRVNAMLI